MIPIFMLFIIFHCYSICKIICIQSFQTYGKKEQNIFLIFYVYTIAKVQRAKVTCTALAQHAEQSTKAPSQGKPAARQRVFIWSLPQHHGTFCTDSHFL